MKNQEPQLPAEENDELMQVGNAHEEMEPPMNGGKKSGRRSRKPKNGKKKKGISMKKKKKGGAAHYKKSLNGLAAVGALFGAQQLYARKNKKALKRTMKKRSSRRSKK